MKRLLYKLAGRLPCRLIDINGKPYLERYHLAKLAGCHIMLHRFVSGDSERHVHDHPWRWALSLILTGSYLEEIAGAFEPGGWLSRVRRVRFINLSRPLTFHRIVEPVPETWTLFITGPRFKGWGFLDVAKGCDQPIVVYGQPHDVETTRDWRLHALPGEEIGRMPMREAA